MRILLLHPVFHPDPSPASRLFTELAADLVQAGHEIEVLTGTAEEGGGGAHYLHSVRIQRLFCGACRPDDRWSCRIGYARFLFSAAWRLWLRKQPDLVLVPSPPPLLMLLAYSLRRLRGTPYVAWTLEAEPTLLHPASGNPLRRRWRSLRVRLIQTALAHANHIVAAGDDLCGSLRTALAPHPVPVECVPMWTDGQHLAPIRPEHNVIARGLLQPGEFTLVSFSEALGTTGLATLAKAYRQLPEAEQPHCLLVGRRTQAHTRKAVSSLLLPQSAQWLATVSLAREGHLYGAANVGLLRLAETEAKSRVPAALSRFLAAGVPVILLGDPQSAIARFLRTQGCGWLIPDGDDGALAGLLHEVQHAPEVMAAARRNARRAFTAHFERKLNTGRWNEILEKARTHAAREASIQAAPFAVPPLAMADADFGARQ